MPSEFVRRPRVLKGALVAYASPALGPVPNVIVFQYNPERVTRQLRHRTASAPSSGEAAGRARAGDAIRVTGPPEESLSMTIVLDATDALADLEPLAVMHGLHPALAALELLLYPSSTRILQNTALSHLGASVVPPAEVPSVLLVWGLGRVVPVRVEAMAITEQAYDPMLNPIRVSVELSLQVLTYLDVPFGTLGHGASVAHHVGKEVLAAANLVNTSSVPLPEVV